MSYKRGSYPLAHVSGSDTAQGPRGVELQEGSAHPDAPPSYSASVGEAPPPGRMEPALQETGRQQWGSKVEFILACVGNAVGLGNLWRFPYLCYSSGGGAFLIPYFIMLVFCGIPLLYMEYATGQFTRQGPVGALQKICPFLQGAGMGTVVLSFLFVTYYNVIMTWAFYYLFSCFQARLPWSHCNNTFNTPLCWDGDDMNGTRVKPNDSVSPSQEFFERRVLEQSAGIEYQGTLKWDLCLILLLTWVLVYLCLWKGIRWTGKVVYFTATFPYLVIVVLLVRGLTLPGADNGVFYFVNPRWELLKDPKVWVNAAAQNFNSIGIAFGSMIAFSSYNKRNNRIFKDVMPVTLINSGTSLLAGFTIFSILGHIALVQNKKVENVATEGPGLVFQVYPEAFNRMPAAHFFAILFFFMLILLAIDSQFASVEVVITTIEDQFGKKLYRYLYRREFLVLIVCCVCFVLGLPNVTNGGIYYFQIIDKYSSGLSLMLIAFFEVAAIAWFYGGKTLADNVEAMTGTRPFLYFVICWYVVSPLLIAGICIFNYVQYTPVTYGKYKYPPWADGLGWGLAGLSLICIPIGMVKGVWQAPGTTFVKKLVNSFKSPLKLRAAEYQEAPNGYAMDGIKYTPTEKAAL